MSRRKKSYVGKVAFCDNATLGITDKYGVPIKGGHYVYIRKVNGTKCDVNIITSLENDYGQYQVKKLDKVKRGMLYPIPKGDADFKQFSAVNLDGNINNVKLSDLQNIGIRKIKDRHKWFVGKFTKTKK